MPGNGDTFSVKSKIDSLKEPSYFFMPTQVGTTEECRDRPPPLLDPSAFGIDAAA